MRRPRRHVSFLAALWFGAGLGPAQAAAEPAAALTGPAALTGQVTAPGEGPLEGVLVSARRDGATITTTVVTDQRGRYSFPAARLSPGHYALQIRATGYELAGPGAVELAAGTLATADLTLRRITDLAAQLTNGEWLDSAPGDAEQKRPLLECMSCHTLERIVRSHHDAGEFLDVFTRMSGYANNTTPAHPQRRPVQRELHRDRLQKVAAYLSTINLSGRATWSYPLKTFARPSGAATRVIITEYAMPRPTVAPHDVRVDAHGKIWFSEFGEPFLGRLDPATGAVTEFRLPELKPGFPTGSLDLEPDKDGNYWLALMFQGGIARFDVRTETFRVWPIPADMNTDTTQQSMVMPFGSTVDGKVWTNQVDKQSILRLDPASGRFEVFDPFQAALTGHAHAPYGMAADARNNLYFMDFGDENIGRIDAKTGRSTLYPTPTPYSRPRRGMLDASGRLWFAEFAANRIGLFDTKSERFQEWEVPTPYTAPYDVVIDRNSELWSGSMNTDRILRLDPETGHTVEYLLPHQTNIRKVAVDNATTPVTFWAGNNHGAAIIKLEPLD